MAAEAIEITKSPMIVQMASPRFMWTNLNLFRHSLSCFAGNSRHAITLPKIRIGRRTTNVPLRYQPIIGAIPNTSRSQGITATVVSHNNREKTPNTMAVVRSPIGAGVVCFSADMAMIRFCCNSSRAPGNQFFAISHLQPTADRCSCNPIYLSFVLLMLGLSERLDDLWLLITLGPHRRAGSN